MTEARRALGQRGEQLAVQHLQKANYNIITTNWHCPYGEIDIVARQSHSLVFVEVRTRSGSSTEAALESIVGRKQQRLTRLAYAYLNQYPSDHWRFDVIAVAIPRYGPPIIDHVEDALNW